jgi:hypothetical protein
MVTLVGRYQVLMKPSPGGIAMVSGVYGPQFASHRLVAQRTRRKPTDLGCPPDRDPLVRALQIHRSALLLVLRQRL